MYLLKITPCDFYEKKTFQVRHCILNLKFEEIFSFFSNLLYNPRDEYSSPHTKLSTQHFFSLKLKRKENYVGTF